MALFRAEALSMRRNWDAAFPQLREFLREQLFLSVLREAAGKTAGKSAGLHGNFAGALREYREMAGAEVMVFRFRVS
ncbi:hypothetical protein ACVWZA_001866 [Sphingomonas sp. UYAg733]